MILFFFFVICQYLIRALLILHVLMLCGVTGGRADVAIGHKHGSF